MIHSEQLFSNRNVVAVALPITCGLGILAGLWLRRYFARRREAERVRLENEQRRDFLVAKMDEMAKLFEDPEIPLPELKARQYLLLAEMEARNENGDLDPLIADNALFLEEQFRKRESK